MWHSFKERLLNAWIQEGWGELRWLRWNDICSSVALVSLSTPFTWNMRRAGITLASSPEGWVLVFAVIFTFQKLGSKFCLPARVNAVEQQGAWSKFIVRAELIKFGSSQSWDVLSDIHAHFMWGAMGSIGWSMSKNPLSVHVWDIY